MSLGILGFCLLLQFGAPEAAQPQPPDVVASSAPLLPLDHGKTLRLAAGTPLEVEIVAPLSSASSHPGDKFSFRLAAPISSDGVEFIAIGALGEGEVIDAAPAGMAGKAGKLILAARRLDLNGRLARVRGFTVMPAGRSRVGLASATLLVPYVGLSALLIKGGNVEIPAGARYTVKLSEDVDVERKSNDQTASELK